MSYRQEIARGYLFGTLCNRLSALVYIHRITFAASADSETVARFPALFIHNRVNGPYSVLPVKV